MCVCVIVEYVCVCMCFLLMFVNSVCLDRLIDHCLDSLADHLVCVSSRCLCLHPCNLTQCPVSNMHTT